MQENTDASLNFISSQNPSAYTRDPLQNESNLQQDDPPQRRKTPTAHGKVTSSSSAYMASEQLYSTENHPINANTADPDNRYQTTPSDEEAKPKRPAKKNMPAEFSDSEADKDNRFFHSFVGVPTLPAGSIRLEKALGQGAFGQVYKGCWGKAARPVALKKIDLWHAHQKLPELTMEEILESLQWEVSRLSTVSHPNCVQFYGIYQNKPQGRTYVVMEFCEGGTLEKALEKNPSWAKRWQWALEISQGLAYLHNQGIIHRDLKAENVLLDKHDCVKLADLGVSQVDALLHGKEAKVVAQGLQDQRFIAPENLDNPMFSSKETDIYALGLVFWQLACSGSQIPRAPQDMERSERNYYWQRGTTHTGQYEREPIPEDCPPAFKQLILACWETEPSQRPSIEEVVGRLRTLDVSPKEPHPQPQLLQTCEQLDALIHPKRLEGLRYIAPYLTEYEVTEPIESYWERFEQAVVTEGQGGGNPPLELETTLTDFLSNPHAHSLLLLGDSGLGKTLTTYLLADRQIGQWWRYVAQPFNPTESPAKPPYLPLFIRPALKTWSHTALQEAFFTAQKYYGITDPRIPLLIIVDGYDECQVDMTPQNLPNQLGLPPDADIKLIITCRPRTVGTQQLKTRFGVQGNLQVRYFLPFKFEQVLNYLTEQLGWKDETREAYAERLYEASNLRTVLRNPFVLHLFVQSFATLSKLNFNQIARWQIYESVVQHWITTHQNLLSKFVQQDLKGNSDSLVESYRAFASDVAFRAFHQGQIRLGRKDVEALPFAWGQLAHVVEEDSQTTFHYPGLEVDCWITEDETALALEALAARQDITPPCLIKLHVDNKTTFHLYGVSEAGKEQVKTLSRSVEQLNALPFVSGNRLRLSEQEHVDIYQEIIEQRAHVKSTRRSVLTETDYLHIKASHVEQFGAGAPLKPRSDGFEFTHKSFFEYFAARHLVALSQAVPSVAETALKALLNARSLQKEPEIFTFWVEGWQAFSDTHQLIEPLFQVITASRAQPQVAQAASNAATLLAKANVSFSRRDLHQVIIPGADLSSNYCWGVQFQGADLRGVNLSGACLNEGNFIDANMTGVNLGEWPSLRSGNRAFCVAYSLDGARLAVGHANSTITLYQKVLMSALLNSTEASYQWQCYQIISAPVNPSSKRREFTKGYHDLIYSVYFSPDGCTLASASFDETIRLWDTVTGAEKIVLTGHTDEVRSVCFSPDGAWLASASDDKTIRLWDAVTGTEKIVLTGHTGKVRSVCFSSDGAWLASASDDKTIRLWNVAQGSGKAILKGHTGNVESVCFSPNGRTLASASADKTVRLWDAAQGTGKAILKGYRRISVYPDGRGCTLASDSVCFNPDGSILASAGYQKVARLWDVAKSSQKTVLTGHWGKVNSVCFSRGGHTLASASDDKTVRLWDVAQGTEKTVLTGHTGIVNSVCFNSGIRRRTLASASDDKTIRLWDVHFFQATEITVLKGHTDRVNSVCFSPDGNTLASASDDKTVRLWDAIKGTEKIVLEGHTDIVNSVCFSPDGNTLASASFAQTIRLWDAVKGTEKIVLEGHAGKVNSVCFSPDGRCLACGCSDYGVYVWWKVLGTERYTEQWQLRYRLGYGLGLWTKRMYLNGAILSENNRLLLEQRGANVKERPAATVYSAALLSQFFSVGESNLSHMGKQIVKKLSKRDAESLACMNRNSYEFFSALKGKTTAIKFKIPPRLAAEEYYQLAIAYRDGKEGVVDPVQAAHYFHLAAAQDHVDAQLQLAVCYDKGDGLNADPTQAAHYYQKAAEQGHAFAQNNLGVAYQCGLGIPQDLTQAVHYYRQAAAQGHVNAKVNLDRLLTTYPHLAQTPSHSLAAL